MSKKAVTLTTIMNLLENIDVKTTRKPSTFAYNDRVKQTCMKQQEIPNLRYKFLLSCSDGFLCFIFYIRIKYSIHQFSEMVTSAELLCY